MTDLLVVTGPTASGKTALGIAVAERLGVEIVSADSMQFYRGMEIGTAAPTPDERARVKHHFVGFLDPDEHFSAGAYERAARAVVADANGRGETPVAVGGSGLYVRALVDGLFPGPARDEEFRRRLALEAEQHGVARLYARLEELDPAYADVIGPNDLRRIVRALEVLEIAGRPLSDLHREHRASGVSLDAVQVALDYPREVLYERINARADRIVREGFLEEVQSLLDGGYGPQIERLRPLGYREMAAHLRGECPLDEALENMKRNTRRFAKRQLTWFRSDKRIQWLPTTADTRSEDHADAVIALLG